MSTEYGGDQIQILEGLEAVRKRPGMYIGSTSSRGLHHLVYEIVDNAVDEALAGFCSEIKIDINEGDTITVSRETGSRSCIHYFTCRWKIRRRRIQGIRRIARRRCFRSKCTF